jgi:hypothetical protein
MKRTNMKPGVRGLSVIILMSLVPLLMGGCTEFRDAFFTSLESATGAALDAALTDLFDQVRSDN